MAELPNSPPPPSIQSSHASPLRVSAALPPTRLVVSVPASQSILIILPSKQTFGSYLTDEWLPGMKSQVRPSTLASYRINVNKHIVPARIGTTKLQRLTPLALNAFYGELGSKVSAKTVRNIHVVIHRALKDAVDEGRVTRNVATVAKPPTVTSSEMKFWSTEQSRAFLAYTRSDRLYALWLLETTTGMRRGELIGLRWSEVDLDAARLRVIRSAVAVDYGVDIQPPKTKKGRRSLNLDATTVSALRSWRKRQNEERLACGEAWQDTGLVFTREDGSMIHPEHLSDLFTRRAKAAGLPRIRFHDLRHTYATAALSAGVHVKVVSERLGHATVAITLDTYSHVLPSMDESAAETVARHILGA